MKILKHLFIVLFLLAFTGSFAQNKYKLIIKPTVGQGNYEFNNNTINSLHCTINFINGTELSYVVSGNDLRSQDNLFEYEFYDSVTGIKDISYTLDTSKGSATTYWQDINGEECLRRFPNFTPRWGIVCESSIVPIIELTRSSESDIVGFDDIMEFTATSGYPDNNYEMWQYQIGGANEDNWVNIPSSTNLGTSSHIFKARPRDFLPEEVMINPAGVNFRLKTCYIYSENVLNYNIRSSAPHISEIIPENVSCYDSSDGKVTIEFDRALKPDESMDIAIADLTKPNDDGSSYVTVKNENGVVLDGENKITVEGLPAGEGEYAIQMVVGLNGNIYYSDGASHSEPFKITRPDNPVDFEIIDVVNVWCNDDDSDPESNNDGEIHIRASGGGPGTYEYSINEEGAINNEWYGFANTTAHAIKGLKANTNYEIRVRKKVGSVYCMAKTQQVVDGKIELGPEKILRQSLEQPEEKLTVEFVDEKWPAAFGYSDGHIKARVYGGTMFDDNSYEFEWRGSDGNLLTDTETEYESGQGYFITLRNLPAGTYYLTVRDKNYNSATYTQGCTVVNSGYELDQPDPLIVEVKETGNISCNSENIYSDPYNDGELTAEAQGGVQLNFMDNGGLPYYYIWSKKDNGGEWELLASERDSILTGATAGEYRVIITDANEITKEQSYTIAQPDLLEITYSKSDLDCDYENKGSISISVTGGVPGYAVQWSNGETTPEIQNLRAGTYIVYVTDSRGCQAIEEITIDQPEDIEIQTVGQRNPTCFEGNDGAIHIEVTGGTAPYSYLWNTADTNPFITDLSEGKYELRITDAKGCVARTEYTLENPDPLTVDLGEDRTICLDQGITYDISIDDPGATYHWESDNGFSSTSPIVELTKGGNYKATVITSQGCEGSDELTVNVSGKEIDAYFLLTTQAFAKEEVILVNVSRWIGESVEWTVPEGVQKVFSDKEGLIVYFEEPGSYDINLRSVEGSCYQDYTKKIIVEEATELPYVSGSSSNFINEFIVYPNPTDGEFKVKVSLAAAADISIKIISLTSSSVMHSRTEKSTNEYLLDYNLELVPGVYIMLLETPQGKEIRKMIFN